MIRDGYLTCQCKYVLFGGIKRKPEFYLLFIQVLVWAHSPQIYPGISNMPSSGTSGSSNETLWKIPAPFYSWPWQVTVQVYSKHWLASSSSSCVSPCALDMTYGCECPVQHNCDKEIGLSSNEDLLHIHQPSYLLIKNF